jgi:hypothetical protein
MTPTTTRSFAPTAPMDTPAVATTTDALRNSRRFIVVASRVCAQITTERAADEGTIAGCGK